MVACVSPWARSRSREGSLDLDAVVARLRRDPLRPPAWLDGPHRQTVVASLLPRAPLPPDATRFVRTDPDTSIRLDIDRGDDRNADTALVVVHGLAGSSASPHVLDIARHARAAGLHVVRMNMRNCGGTAHLTPTLYHGNHHQDLHAVVRALPIVAPRVRKLVLAGYSLGGDLVLNALAAWGARAPQSVVGAVAVCPTLDLARSVARIDSPGNRAYRHYYLASLKRFYRRKSALFGERHPLARLRGVETMRQLDAQVSAPSAGFADVDAFYDWVSSGPRLGAIDVPTLLVRALDDPLVDPSTALARNPSIRAVATERGGHCGFLELPSRRRPDGRWAPYQIVRFAIACTGRSE